MGQTPGPDDGREPRQAPQPDQKPSPSHTPEPRQTPQPDQKPSPSHDPEPRQAPQPKPGQIPTPVPMPVIGAIQHYAWGDTEFIPGLLGESPDGQPWAELWLGTHGRGPTALSDGTPLRDLTGELPYLLKVLAAAQPLSLQVHPNTEQAADGFARGIYADSRAKPELLCALSPFEAFCGVRPVAATLAMLGEIGADSLASTIVEAGVPTVIAGLYRGLIDPRPAIEACRSSRRPEARWVTKLDALYPGDRSVVVTLLLNFVQLEPGEAIHLTAGNLHAYLGGAGIELMGSSDNVVRGGLTHKHVDVDELLRILDAAPLIEPIMPGAVEGLPGRYPLPEAGCELLRIEAGQPHVSTGDEIAICLDGATNYLPPGSAYEPGARAFVVVKTPMPPADEQPADEQPADEPWD